MKMSTQSHIRAVAAVAVFAVGLAGCASTARPRVTQPPENPVMVAAAQHVTDTRAPADRTDSAAARSPAMRHTRSPEGRSFDADVSGDGMTLVYAATTHARRPELFVKDIAGERATRLTDDPASDVQPRFSPDGERIAFASNRAGGWDIWVMQRDGTAPRRLTDDAADEVAPCWSPDGTRIAYSHWNALDSCWEIWSRAASSDAPDALPPVRIATGRCPAWSPDGKRILFQRARERGDGRHSIWMVDVSGDSPRHVTELVDQPGYSCILPAWSPRGDWISYSRVEVEPGNELGRPAAALLLATHLRSGRTVAVVSTTAPAWNCAWSAGDRLFFVRSDDVREDVWSVESPLTPAEATNVR